MTSKLEFHGKSSPASLGAPTPSVGATNSSPELGAGEAFVDCVPIAGTNLLIYDSSEMCGWRAESFWEKEPHTIKWLDTLTDEDVLYDVGANIGVYSLYAAAVRGVRVYAFEPEATNYAELVRNIRLNGVEDRITPYMLAIGDTDGLTTLNINDTRVGGSCHTAGAEVGSDLEARTPVYKQPVFVCRLDSLAEMDLPDPTAIKVDVDGLEHLVVDGGDRVFRESIRTAILDLSSNLVDHTNTARYLASLGLNWTNAQWQDAQRKEGPFKGTGECIFARESIDESIRTDSSIRTDESIPAVDESIRESMTEGVGLAQPYATQPRWSHLVEPWSPSLYADMLDMFPVEYLKPLDDRQAVIIDESIDESIGDESMARFWENFRNQFLTHSEYHRDLMVACGVPLQSVTVDALLVRDLPGYAINPHTDRPHRLLTALYYLAPVGTYDNDLGTSFYRRFGDQGDPHGEHRDPRDFERLLTVPYAANTGLVFPRTDHSYHGVERTARSRDLLIVNLRKG